jgi:hypothetical protein
MKERISELLPNPLNSNISYSKLLSRWLRPNVNMNVYMNRVLHTDLTGYVQERKILYIFYTEVTIVVVIILGE